MEWRKTIFELLTVINSEGAKNRIAALRVDMAKGAQWVSVECFREI